MDLIVDAGKYCRQGLFQDQQEVLLGLLIVHVQTELLVQAVHGVIVQVFYTAVHHQLEEVGYQLAVATQVNISLDALELEFSEVLAVPSAHSLCHFLA